MSLPLAYTPEALTEIDEAYVWHEEQRSGLGEEFLTTLREQLNLIEESPLMYAVLYRGVRGGPMKRFPYVVYYRAETDRTTVIAMHHGSRSPRAWRRRARP